MPDERNNAIFALMGRQLLEETRKPPGECNTARALGLIRGGASLEEKNIFGDTPLIWSAMHGHADIAKALIEKGARTEVKNRNDNSALDWAMRNGHAEIIDMLKTAQGQDAAAAPAQPPPEGQHRNPAAEKLERDLAILKQRAPKFRLRR